MVTLSSVASAILNSISDTKKTDSKSGDASFLTLLNSNATDLSALDTDQSLVDSLYSKDDDEMALPAAPMEPNVKIYHDDSKPLLAPAPREAAPAPKEPPKESPREASDNASPVRAATPAKKDSADKNDKPDSQTAKTEDNATPVKASSKDAKTDDDSDRDAAVEKIRNKINDLKDLLAMLTSLAGNGAGSVTTVTVTQVTVTSQQAGFDSNGNFIDLSDRFKQLIAAINASQKLPTDTKEALTTTISAFQSLLTPQAATDGTISDGTPDTFLSLFTDFQKNLQDLVSSMSASQTTNEAATPVQADMQQALADIGNWAKDFRTLIAQTKNQAALHKALQPAIDTSFAGTKEITQAAGGSQAPLPLNPLLHAQALNNAANTNNNYANNNAAAAVANVASSNNNMSGSTDSGSEGGGNSAAAPVTSTAPSGLSAANASNAPSFAKALSAASAASAPAVAEQVVFHIKTMVKDGSSKIQIHLDPVELGKLSIKLEVDAHGKTGVVITADNKSTLDLLQRDSRGLEQALADAGLKTDSGSLSFNLRGGDQQNEQQQAFSGYAKLQPEPEDELAPLSVLTQNYAIQVTDGLDIKI